MEPKWIRTSETVYHTLLFKHEKDLVVFSTVSYPEGYPGYSDMGEMYTEWGFKGRDLPMFAKRTTFDLGEQDEHGFRIRTNEKHEYWLCIGAD